MKFLNSRHIANKSLPPNNNVVPIESLPQMARARMREATLLGLFFCVPLGYTLLARFLNRNADDLPIYPNEELRFGKALQPVVHLLVRQ